MTRIKQELDKELLTDIQFTCYLRLLQNRWLNEWRTGLAECALGLAWLESYQERFFLTLEQKRLGSVKS